MKKESIPNWFQWMFWRRINLKAIGLISKTITENKALILKETNRTNQRRTVSIIWIMRMIQTQMNKNKTKTQIYQNYWKRDLQILKEFSNNNLICHLNLETASTSLVMSGSIVTATVIVVYPTTETQYLFIHNMTTVSFKKNYRDNYDEINFKTKITRIFKIISRGISNKRVILKIFL
jgi:hypothetical protein